MSFLIKNSCDGFYADSLDVRFTKQCDNNCPFCIEKNGISGKPTDVQKLIESTILSGRKDILILGGEPLLKIHDVLSYVIGIRRYVRNIYITTSLPETIMKNITTFKSILSLIDGINVSLQHYNAYENNKIMRSSNMNFNRINALKTLCLDSEFAQKARVSINLVKGAIDSKEEIDRFLDVMEEIGVRHVKINELQGAEDLYVNFEETYGIKYKSPYFSGCQKPIALPKHNLLITLKRACFKCNKKLQPSKLDLIKLDLMANKEIHTQKVLYEDGTLSDGWIYYEN